MKRNLTLATTTLLTSILVAPVQAGILFDPDGPGGDPVIDVGIFDWAPTSFVADEGQTAISNFLANEGDPVTFDVYTHARLIGTTNPSGDPNPAGGLGSAYEITMIAGFGESITDVGFLGTSAIATFAVNPGGLLSDGSAPFVEFYYDPIPAPIGSNAVDLSGSGFNDGRKILAATTITNTPTGIFSVDFSTLPVLLDGFGTDDWSVGVGGVFTQDSLTGTGGNSAIEVDGITTDPTHFKNAFLAMGLEFANVSIQIPFTSVDPSDCYTSAPTAAAVGADQAVGGCSTTTPLFNGLTPFASFPEVGAGALVPFIGLTNGFLLVGEAPDFIAQTDFNSPVQGVAPEPGMVALLGLGLGLLGWSMRKSVKA